MKISVIIPIKNQAEKLLKNLKDKILPYFDSCGVTYEVIIAPNGFDADQKEILSKGMEQMPAQVRLLPFLEEGGKGRGARYGILASEADYDLIMDADCATDLRAFDLIKPDLGKYDAFVANRDLPESYQNKRPFLRRMGHKVSIWLVRKKFGFHDIGDTQCGYKCYRHSMAVAMVKKQTIMGYAYDVEHCYFITLNHFSVKEIPVHWENDEAGTSVSFFSSSKAFSKDLKRIKKNKQSYILTEEERKAIC